MTNREAIVILRDIAWHLDAEDIVRHEVYDRGRWAGWATLLRQVADMCNWHAEAMMQDERDEHGGNVDDEDDLEASQ